jgi:hypothetical protein
MLYGTDIDLRIHRTITSTISEVQYNCLYDFIEFCAQEIPVQGPIVVYLLPRNTNAKITTGGYNTEDNSISSRWEGRQTADVARTIAHELIHYGQKERGEFDDPNYVHQDIGGPIENEANAVAGVLLKRFAQEKNGQYIYAV